jgi:hypothetical protein
VFLERIIQKKAKKILKYIREGAKDAYLAIAIVNEILKFVW